METYTHYVIIRVIHIIRGRGTTTKMGLDSTFHVIYSVFEALLYRTLLKELSHFF